MPLKCPIFCLRFGIDERSHVKTAKSLNEVTAGENCVTFHTVMLCSVFFSEIQLVKLGFSEKATNFEKIFVVLLTRASCSMLATAYLSKSRQRFFKTNVVKSFYTNIKENHATYATKNELTKICNEPKTVPS